MNDKHRPAEPSTPAPNQMSIYKGGTGMQRIINALGYSLAGLKTCYANEAAFRQESWLSLLLILVSFFLPVSRTEHAVMIASVVLVLIVELLNSAIEAVVDRISLETHELSKRAKDAGSAAVLLALLNVMAVWGYILFGKL